MRRRQVLAVGAVALLGACFRRDDGTQIRVDSSERAAPPEDGLTESSHVTAATAANRAAR